MNVVKSYTVRKEALLIKCGPDVRGMEDRALETIYMKEAAAPLVCLYL